MDGNICANLPSQQTKQLSLPGTPFAAPILKPSKSQRNKEWEIFKVNNDFFIRNYSLKGNKKTIQKTIISLKELKNIILNFKCNLRIIID